MRRRWVAGAVGRAAAIVSTGIAVQLKSKEVDRPGGKARAGCEMAATVKAVK